MQVVRTTALLLFPGAVVLTIWGMLSVHPHGLAYTHLIYISFAGHEDYGPLNTTVTLSPNESRKTLIITTHDDSIVDQNETFTVQLVSNSKQVSIHNTEVITITIEDGK